MKLKLSLFQNYQNITEELYSDTQLIENLKAFYDYDQIKYLFKNGKKLFLRELGIHIFKKFINFFNKRINFFPT